MLYISEFLSDSTHISKNSKITVCIVYTDLSMIIVVLLESLIIYSKHQCCSNTLIMLMV